ncbi:MAG: AAA family ATPase [Hyphomonas sp.]
MGYAYWRKCDFQVHSCRDPNWTGDRPLGVGEVDSNTDTVATKADVDVRRAEWADTLVENCVKKGLEAFALTDHHETVMVPYVRAAIERRKASDPQFDLWFFPGMELTASGGCQCLILFDTDISDEWLTQAQGKLGIAHAAQDASSAKSQKVEQLKLSYPEIAGALDEVEKLRGRYIVLPNVSEGGKHTVLKDGHHALFLQMPYVGGYLDTAQTINSLGSKNRKRLSGTDKTWSQREIYPLPTSDSRSADFATLGENNTWIKLSTPTAEAIRQAFLAHPSRIRIETPGIPSLVVSRIEINGSTILSTTAMGLSPELNSIIGGRGSGKSSLLEYLAFGLCRSSYDVPRGDYSGTQRLHDLVQETLYAKGGVIKLEVVQDNARFEITRGPGTAHNPQVKYPNGSMQTLTDKELRALFPAVVYSQGELAEIGKQASKKTELTDLLQFVGPDYKREDDRLSSDIQTAKAAVKSAIDRQSRTWAIQALLRRQTAEREALKERVAALEKTLPAQSPEDQARLDYFEKSSEFEAKRLQASKHADQVLADLIAMESELVSERDLTSSLASETTDIRLRYDEFFKAFAQGLANLRNDLKLKRATLLAAETAWGDAFKEARTARDGVLSKLASHKTATAQIIKLREEIASANEKIGDLEGELKAQGNPSEEVTRAVVALRKAAEQRAERTKQWAQEIEELSSKKIKAVVDDDSDTSEIKDALDLISAKTGSKEATRIAAVEDRIGRDGAWNTLDKLRTDCLAVLYWRSMGSSSGEDQPKFEELAAIIGETEKIRAALIELMDSARIEAIATAVPKPQISLFYCDDKRELAFEKASEGQRAAALLFMLLQQPGGPLIIDQPEGDLDNSIIADLTAKLHIAKQKRQIVFASHNANIVVNGSSELVVHLHPNEAGYREIEQSGAIDDDAIRLLITSTMEGGQKAFKDRLDKYGF